ncbi:hypothetical protein SAMN04515667_0571 [Formosa sp. Hel1_31_208]|uniref:hypothetical protein n=1 Tax=Formosa sp. Hel1_31_208 TaxID=1798225 RepID=UPI00087BE367|nr:hypothetical protein [Formosa sp. Hel1_31_208]SDR75945.1 hypothetical protein SAMN04515667_0571 [Formosa sp. Hel1_31_208]
MKVSQDQIENLYAFTIKHFVEYYDLQTELVDHLANDIEAIWRVEPELTFDQARNKSFKKFGIYGFAEIVEKRQKAMNKRYLKCLWHELKTWFTLPKVMTTLSLFALCYMIFSSSISEYAFIAAYIVTIIWTVYKIIQLNRQFRRRKQKTDKKWLLEQIIFRQASGINLIFISQLANVINYSDVLYGNQTAIAIASLSFTSCCLLLYVSLQLLPNKADELLKEAYPEFCL